MELVTNAKTVTDQNCNSHFVYISHRSPVFFKNFRLPSSIFPKIISQPSVNFSYTLFLLFILEA